MIRRTPLRILLATVGMLTFVAAGALSLLFLGSVFADFSAASRNLASTYASLVLGIGGPVSLIGFAIWRWAMRDDTRWMAAAGILVAAIAAAFSLVLVFALDLLEGLVAAFFGGLPVFLAGLGMTWLANAYSRRRKA